ncbi:hypothetical protein PR048_004054 [Dryococelus australis]|uniref:Uncharacterized protein n=1 Tax=Dryococelus australis TaxID=614101 RepID=A0ABQ9I4H1_9NEOP|nr:hypothetical protein PR048_004054 [Dryococelus australis]
MCLHEYVTEVIRVGVPDLLVPPHQMLVYANSGRPINSAVIGPLTEGSELTLTCEGNRFISTHKRPTSLLNALQIGTCAVRSGRWQLSLLELRVGVEYFYATAKWVRLPAGSLPDFCKWKSLRTMQLVGGFFHEISRPFHSSAAPYSPRFALISSQDLELGFKKEGSFLKLPAHALDTGTATKTKEPIRATLARAPSDPIAPTRKFMQCSRRAACTYETSSGDPAANKNVFNRKNIPLYDFINALKYLLASSLGMNYAISVQGAANANKLVSLFPGHGVSHTTGSNVREVNLGRTLIYAALSLADGTSERFKSAQAIKPLPHCSLQVVSNKSGQLLRHMDAEEDVGSSVALYSTAHIFLPFLLLSCHWLRSPLISTLTFTIIAIGCMSGSASEHVPKFPDDIAPSFLGATVAEWLACSPSTKASWVLFPLGSLPDDAAGRRAFSGFSRFPRPFIRVLIHYYPITLIGSQDLAAASVSRRRNMVTLDDERVTLLLDGEDADGKYISHSSISSSIEESELDKNEQRNINSTGVRNFTDGVPFGVPLVSVVSTRWNVAMTHNASGSGEGRSALSRVERVCVCVCVCGGGERQVCTLVKPYPVLKQRIRGGRRGGGARVIPRVESTSVAGSIIEDTRSTGVVIAVDSSLLVASQET